eukprot:1779197-Rhodomonas_salina.1
MSRSAGSSASVVLGYMPCAFGAAAASDDVDDTVAADFGVAKERSSSRVTLLLSLCRVTLLSALCGVSPLLREAAEAVAAAYGPSLDSSFSFEVLRGGRGGGGRLGIVSTSHSFVAIFVDYLQGNSAEASPRPERDGIARSSPAVN